MEDKGQATSEGNQTAAVLDSTPNQGNRMKRLLEKSPTGASPDSKLQHLDEHVDTFADARSIMVSDFLFI